MKRKNANPKTREKKRNGSGPSTTRPSPSPSPPPPPPRGAPRGTRRRPAPLPDGGAPGGKRRSVNGPRRGGGPRESSTSALVMPDSPGTSAGASTIASTRREIPRMARQRQRSNHVQNEPSEDSNQAPDFPPGSPAAVVYYNRSLSYSARDFRGLSTFALIWTNQRFTLPPIEQLVGSDLPLGDFTTCSETTILTYQRSLRGRSMFRNESSPTVSYFESTNMNHVVIRNPNSSCYLSTIGVDNCPMHGIQEVLEISQESGEFNSYDPGCILAVEGVISDGEAGQSSGHQVEQDVAGELWKTLVSRNTETARTTCENSSDTSDSEDMREKWDGMMHLDSPSTSRTNNKRKVNKFHSPRSRCKSGLPIERPEAPTPRDASRFLEIPKCGRGRETDLEEDESLEEAMRGIAALNIVHSATVELQDQNAELDSKIIETKGDPEELPAVEESVGLNDVIQHNVSVDLPTPSCVNHSDRAEMIRDQCGLQLATEDMEDDCNDTMRILQIDGPPPPGKVPKTDVEEAEEDAEIIIDVEEVEIAMAAAYPGTSSQAQVRGSITPSVYTQSILRTTSQPSRGTNRTSYSGSFMNQPSVPSLSQPTVVHTQSHTTTTTSAIPTSYQQITRTQHGETSLPRSSARKSSTGQNTGVVYEASRPNLERHPDRNAATSTRSAQNPRSSLPKRSSGMRTPGPSRGQASLLPSTSRGKRSDVTPIPTHAYLGRGSQRSSLRSTSAAQSSGRVSVSSSSHSERPIMAALPVATATSSSSRDLRRMTRSGRTTAASSRNSDRSPTEIMETDTSRERTQTIATSSRNSDRSTTQIMEADTSHERTQTIAASSRNSDRSTTQIMETDTSRERTQTIAASSRNSDRSTTQIMETDTSHERTQTIAASSRNSDRSTTQIMETDTSHERTQTIAASSRNSDRSPTQIMETDTSREGTQTYVPQVTSDGGTARRQNHSSNLPTPSPARREQVLDSDESYMDAETLTPESTDASDNQPCVSDEKTDVASYGRPPSRMSRPSPGDPVLSAANAARAMLSDPLSHHLLEFLSTDAARGGVFAEAVAATRIGNAITPSGHPSPGPGSVTPTRHRLPPIAPTPPKRGYIPPENYSGPLSFLVPSMEKSSLGTGGQESATSTRPTFTQPRLTTSETSDQLIGSTQAEPLNLRQVQRDSSLPCGSRKRDSEEELPGPSRKRQSDERTANQGRTQNSTRSLSIPPRAPDSLRSSTRSQRVLNSHSSSVAASSSSWTEDSTRPDNMEESTGSSLSRRDKKPETSSSRDKDNLKHPQASERRGTDDSSSSFISSRERNAASTMPTHMETDTSNSSSATSSRKRDSDGSVKHSRRELGQGNSPSSSSRGLNLSSPVDPARRDPRTRHNTNSSVSKEVTKNVPAATSHPSNKTDPSQSSHQALTTDSFPSLTLSTSRRTLHSILRGEDERHYIPTTFPTDYSVSSNAPSSSRPFSRQQNGTSGSITGSASPLLSPPPQHHLPGPPREYRGFPSPFNNTSLSAHGFTSVLPSTTSTAAASVTATKTSHIAPRTTSTFAPTAIPTPVEPMVTATPTHAMSMASAVLRPTARRTVGLLPTPAWPRPVVVFPHVPSSSHRYIPASNSLLQHPHLTSQQTGPRAPYGHAPAWQPVSDGTRDSCPMPLLGHGPWPGPHYVRASIPAPVPLLVHQRSHMNVPIRPSTSVSSHLPGSAQSFIPGSGLLTVPSTRSAPAPRIMPAGAPMSVLRPAPRVLSVALPRAIGGTDHRRFPAPVSLPLPTPDLGMQPATTGGIISVSTSRAPSIYQPSVSQPRLLPRMPSGLLPTPRAELYHGIQTEPRPLLARNPSRGPVPTSRAQVHTAHHPEPSFSHRSREPVPSVLPAPQSQHLGMPGIRNSRQVYVPQPPRSLAPASQPAPSRHLCLTNSQLGHLLESPQVILHLPHSTPSSMNGSEGSHMPICAPDCALNAARENGPLSLTTPVLVLQHVRLVKPPLQQAESTSRNVPESDLPFPDHDPLPDSCSDHNYSIPPGTVTSPPHTLELVPSSLPEPVHLTITTSEPSPLHEPVFGIEHMSVPVTEPEEVVQIDFISPTPETETENAHPSSRPLEPVSESNHLLLPLDEETQLPSIATSQLSPSTVQEQVDSVSSETDHFVGTSCLPSSPASSPDNDHCLEHRQPTPALLPDVEVQLVSSSEQVRVLPESDHPFEPLSGTEQNLSQSGPNPETPCDNLSKTCHMIESVHDDCESVLAGPPPDPEEMTEVSSKPATEPESSPASEISSSENLREQPTSPSVPSDAGSSDAAGPAEASPTRTMGLSGMLWAAGAGTWPQVRWAALGAAWVTAAGCLGRSYTRRAQRRRRPPAWAPAPAHALRLTLSDSGSIGESLAYGTYPDMVFVVLVALAYDCWRAARYAASLVCPSARWLYCSDRNFMMLLPWESLLPWETPVPWPLVEPARIEITQFLHRLLNGVEDDEAGIDPSSQETTAEEERGERLLQELQHIVGNSLNGMTVQVATGVEATGEAPTAHLHSAAWRMQGCQLRTPLPALMPRHCPSLTQSENLQRQEERSRPKPIENKSGETNERENHQNQEEIENHPPNLEGAPQNVEVMDVNQFENEETNYESMEDVEGLENGNEILED